MISALISRMASATGCAALCISVLSSCAQGNNSHRTKTWDEMNQQQTENTVHSKDTATFAAGCFWCVEAQFQLLNGVDTVISGFTGGTTENPDYRQVCTGITGHAEACNIIYDPAVISFDELLAAFFTAHDPTQLNRQGNDIGTQYRSAVFYHNTAQKEKVEYYIQKLNEEGAYDAPIVTEVQPYTTFYEAEDYHQNYYNLNSSQPYCQLVVKPKMEKFRKVFGNKLKH